MLSCSPKESYREPPDENRDKSSKHLKGHLKKSFYRLPFTDSNREVVIARNEAILMRTLVAIVVRLLHRLKSLLAMTILGSLSTAKEIYQITSNNSGHVNVIYDANDMINTGNPIFSHKFTYDPTVL
ncbi:hypothetical protein D3C72_2079300 [compost metagenome]